MARFYDTLDSGTLLLIETVLKQNGIVYALEDVTINSHTLREIRVAEEDLAAAEDAVASLTALNYRLQR